MAIGTLALTVLLMGQVAAPNDVAPIGRRSFGIPITVEPAQRPLIQSLILFSSSDQGKNWKQEASAGPDQRMFTFSAPTDGVYWFSVTVVDQKGKHEPPSPYQEAPSQKILVDTQKPVVVALTGDRSGDEVTVNWDVQEENPSLDTLRVEYKMGEGAGASWQPVPVSIPQLKGEARFKVTGSSPVTVRLEIKDVAGNAGDKEAPVSVSAAPVAAAPPPPPPPPVVPVTSAAPVVSPVTVERQPPAAFTPPGYPATPSGGYPAAPMASGKQDIAWAGVPTEEVQRVSGFSESSPPSPSPLPLPRLQIVNTREITVDYDIRAGASGLSSVQMFVTRDDGRTWEFLADDPDLRSPISVTLPGEGIYGLRLMVVSGVLLTKGPPKPGDLPEMRVEVDTTPPEVHLHKPRADASRRDCLILSWEAKDRNLAARPIILEYAEDEAGPWQQIAADQPKDGTFCWQLPPKVKSKVHLRATAADTAGNRTVAQTRDAQVIDLNQPEASIISLHAAQPRQGP